jgi:hypothetical protein
MLSCWNHVQKTLASDIYIYLLLIGHMQLSTHFFSTIQVTMAVRFSSLLVVLRFI